MQTSTRGHNYINSYEILHDFFYLLLLISCVSYEPLEIYKDGFQSDSSCVNTNGYYLRLVKPSDEPTLVMEHFHPLFFYKDGSFLYAAYYSDSLVLKEEIINYPNNNSNWGFYKCTDDEFVEAEFIHRYNLRQFKRSDISFKVSSDKLIDNLGYEYEFIPFKHKYDSTNNWLKTHRKYKVN